MPSLHQLTHIMSVIVISFLLKKYIEVRLQHQELMAEYEGLASSCRTDLYARPYHDRKNNVCSCQGYPTSSPTSYSHTPDLPKNTQVPNLLQPLSSKGSEIYLTDHEHQLDLQLDEFGRTAGYAGMATEAPFSESTVTERQGNNGLGAQLLPLAQDGPGRHTLVLPSFTSDIKAFFTELAQGEIKEQDLNGKTDWKEHSNKVVLLTMTESVGQIRPSPSMDSANDASHFHSYHQRLEQASSLEVKNDFYFGSSSNKRVDDQHHHQMAITQVTIRNSGDWSGQEKAKLQTGVVDSPISENDVDDFEEEDEWRTQDDKPVELEKQTVLDLDITLMELSQTDVDKLSLKGTSAECVGATVSERTCRFKNLCLNVHTHDFVVFHSKQSLFVNVPAHEQNPVLLELSTVAGHNGHHFSYVDIPAKELKQFRVYFFQDFTVIFNRFKPDNLMHVFHDDIIPLFHTLHSLKLKPAVEPGKFPVALFLADGGSKDNEFLELYKQLVDKTVFTIDSLKVGGPEELFCFMDAEVGLSKATMWYQYGFFEPQGPLNSSKVTADHIHNVSLHFLHYFAKECVFCGMGKYLVLMVRKETRLIVNEIELVMAISQEFRVKVMTVSLETYSLADMIPVIHHSMGIVGMHGSLLSMAIFLQPDSILVELFPFKINPSRYTPYKTLCEIPGMNIVYRTWVNRESHNSIPHPDQIPELGGIHHLPLQSQQIILAQTEVPTHLCCEDPSWLYHIFQDTVVKIPEVIDEIRSALQEAENHKLQSVSEGDFSSVKTSLDTASTSMLDQEGYSRDHNTSPELKLVPGPIQQTFCKFETMEDMNVILTVTWDPPWNLALIQGNHVQYNILVQDSESQEYFTLSLGNVNEYRIYKGVKAKAAYRVWVQCISDGAQGPYSSMTMCS